MWRESTHQIVQFQLAWKRPAKLHDKDHVPEEVVTWSLEHGIRQDQVLDAGRYRTPILDYGAVVQIDELVSAFAKEAEPSSYPDVRFVLRERKKEREQ